MNNSFVGNFDEIVQTAFVVQGAALASTAHD